MERHATALANTAPEEGRDRMIRLAKNGLPARVSGPWTQHKLSYLQKYAAAFMKAMAPKRKQGKWDQLVYLDLLAGPGRGIDADTGAEFDGSPLRALKVSPAFDRLFLADIDPKNVKALRSRILKQDSPRVELKVGDCNVLVKEVLAKVSKRSLGLAFVDPEGFEVKFTFFQELATRRIDVLFLFPSGIGIRRNIAAFVKQTRSPMDDLWGGREWRELPAAKLAAGKRLSQEELRSLEPSWVMRWRNKMASIGFHYQDQADPYFTNEKNVPMYHLLFFSQHLAGLTIWRGIKRIEPSGQRILPL